MRSGAADLDLAGPDGTGPVHPCRSTHPQRARVHPTGPATPRPVRLDTWRPRRRLPSDHTRRGPTEPHGHPSRCRCGADRPGARLVHAGRHHRRRRIGTRPPDVAGQRARRRRHPGSPGRERAVGPTPVAHPHPDGEAGFAAGHAQQRPYVVVASSNGNPAQLDAVLRWLTADPRGGRLSTVPPCWPSTIGHRSSSRSRTRPRRPRPPPTTGAGTARASSSRLQAPWQPS